MVLYTENQLPGPKIAKKIEKKIKMEPMSNLSKTQCAQYQVAILFDSSLSNLKKDL